MAAIVANTGSNNWNTNGAWVGAVQPTAADDVTIPATAVVTIPTAVTALCRSCTVAISGTLAFATTTSVLTIGDATAGAGNVAFANAGTITLTGLGTINFISTSTTVQTVATGGQTMPNQTFNAASNGSWKLTSANTSTGTVTLTKGTLDVNGQTCNWLAFSSSVGNVRVLTLGAAAITITSTGSIAWNALTTSLTITANTATVTLTGSGGGFNSGANYNGMSLVFAGNSTQAIAGSPTVANFTYTGPSSRIGILTISGALTVAAGGTFTVNGQSILNRALVSSATVGTTATITAPATAFSNVDFMDITGAGAGSWNVSAISGLSGDCGGNTGLTFTASVQQTWSGTSGGNTSTNAWTTRVPLAHDDVVINAAFIAAQTVNFDMPRAGRTLDWTGVSGSLAWTYNATIMITGNLKFNTGIGSMPATGFFWDFMGRGAQTITSGGKAWTGSITSASTGASIRIKAPGGSYTLVDAFTSNGFFGVENGHWNTAGFAFQFGVFSLNVGSATRSITSGGSTWTSKAPAGNVVTVPWTSIATGLTINDSITQVWAETDVRIKNGALRYDSTTVSNESSFYCARPATLTDDLEVILRVSPDTWLPGLRTGWCGIWNNTAESGVTSQDQWAVGLETTNVLRFSYSTTGAAASTVIATAGHGFAASDGTKWLKFTRVKSTGAIDFYTAADTGNNTPPGAWTHVGATVTGSTSSYFNSTSPLYVGGGVESSFSASAATIYYATIASSVGGASVATFDPSTQADGTRSFVGSSGNTWIAHQTGDRSTARIVGGRVVLPGTAGSYLSTPDTAALSITSDIDIVARIAPSDWTPAVVPIIVSKRASASQFSYEFRIQGAGNLELGLSVDGTVIVLGTSSVITSFTDFTPHWVRATWRQSDGRVQFFTCADQATEPTSGQWVQLGTDRTIAIASIFDSTSIVEVGTRAVGTANFLNGQIYRVIIKSGIDGTPVFDADLSAIQDHSMLFREKSSNAAIVTVNQANRTTRTWNQTTLAVPGTLTVEGGGGSSMIFASSLTAVSTLPTSITIPGGRTVSFTAGHLFKIASWTQTTSATAGANVILSTILGTSGYLPMSGTTGPTVNYVNLRDNNVSILPPATFFEDFTLRGDSTNNLGNLDTGQTWAQSGGTWGYLGGRMYQSAGGANSSATFDSALTDIDVRLVVTTLATAVRCLARWVDANNFYYAQVDVSGNMQLFKIVAGVSTQLGTTQTVFVVGDELGLRVSGTTIELLHNGNVRVAVTDAALSAGTKIGVGLSASSTTWRASSFRAGAPQFGRAGIISFDAGNNFNWMLDSAILTSSTIMMMGV